MRINLTTVALLGALCLATQICYAQQVKSETPNSLVSTATSCAVRVKAAHSAGYKDGFTEGAKAPTCPPNKSQADWLAGFTYGLGLNTVDLGSTEGKIPCQEVFPQVSPR
jgi:hypothetical protein